MIPFWTAAIVYAVLMYGCRALFGPKIGRPNATGGEFMMIVTLVFVTGFLTGVIKY